MKYTGYETLHDYLFQMPIPDGEHTLVLEANGENVEIDIEMYNFYGDVIYDGVDNLGNDIPDEKILVLKYHGNLTITQDAIFRPKVRKKGMLIWVNGVLKNNGTISMTARGARAEGQNVYLWKNRDGSFEYVPAEGALGGAGAFRGSQGNVYGTAPGIAANRQTGGGGAGSGTVGGPDRSVRTGSGSAGTSYSGGSGGGGAVAWRSGHVTAGNGETNGGRGGNASVAGGGLAGAGAGNPSGTNGGAQNVAQGGTGGLLIIYASVFDNTDGDIQSNGSRGGWSTSNGNASGGGSGGGSVNIFYQQMIGEGSITATGGISGHTSAYGGDGCVTLTWIFFIENINISKTNIWYTDKDNINLSCLIIRPANKDVKYKVLVNNTKAVELDSFISTPTNINIDIPIDLFTKEENSLELIVIDELGLETHLSYIIKKENRDTFTFKRVFDSKEDYISDGNIDVIYNKGVVLRNSGIGEINLNIPTEGKSRIKNIEIMDNNQNKGSKSIVPPLTSNSQNGYEVSASSVYNSTYPAWKAFDGKNASATDAWLSSGKSPQWLQIKLPKPIIAYKYSITSRVQYTQPPKSWVFQGSIDGAVWVDLDVQVDVPGWGVNKTREYCIRQNIDSYQWYRIYITDSYGNENYIAIGELKLYETDFDIIEEVTIDNEMEYIQDLGAGKVYESRLLTEYTDIVDIEVI